METLRAILSTALILATVVVLIMLVYYLQPGLWLRARMAGLPMKYRHLVRMRWQQVPLRQVVDAAIRLHRKEMPYSWQQLQDHALKGGSLENVVNGLIAAREKGLNLSFEKAAEADLQGIDLNRLIAKAKPGRTEDHQSS